MRKEIRQNITVHSVMIILAILAILVISSIGAVSAADIGVNQTTATSSESSYHSNLKDAVNNAVNKDVITVYNGTYKESSNKEITISKNLTIQSAKSAGKGTGETVFDAEGQGKFFTITPNNTVVFKGITFLNAGSNNVLQSNAVAIFTQKDITINTSWGKTNITNFFAGSYKPGGVGVTDVDTVFFAPGNYGNASIIVKNSLNLVGFGAKFIGYAPKSLGGTYQFNMTGIRVERAKNVNIFGFSFVDYGASIAVNNSINTLISGISVLSANCTGVYINNSKNTVLQYSELISISDVGNDAESAYGMFASRGIRVKYSNETTLSNNYVTGFGRGTEINYANVIVIKDNEFDTNSRAQGIDLQNSKDAAITNNVIHGSTYRGNPGINGVEGIRVINSTNVDISYNEIYDLQNLTGVGIMISGGLSSPCQNITIRKNIIYQVSLYGVQLFNNVADVKVIDNNIFDIGIDAFKGSTYAVSGIYATFTSNNGRLNNAEISGNTISNVLMDGIYLYGANNVNIFNNDITGIGDKGIYSYNTTKLDINNNNFKNMKNINSSAIYLSNYNHYATITDNDFDDVKYGIYVYYLNDYVTISKNTLNNVKDSAIYVYHTNLNLNITENNISNAKQGISSYTYNHNINIAKNIISNIETTAISVLNSNHAVINNNNVFNTVSGALYLGNSNNSKIINNVFDISTGSTGLGIFAYSSNDVTIANNDISNSVYGIYMQNMLRALVNNNAVTSTSKGIYLANAVDDSVIKNNSLIKNNNGVYVIKSKNSEISFNKFYENAVSGITLYNIATGFAISSNDIVNNGIGIFLKGIENGDISSNNLSYNRIYNNSVAALSSDINGGSFNNNVANFNWWGNNNPVKLVDGVDEIVTWYVLKLFANTTGTIVNDTWQFNENDFVVLSYMFTTNDESDHDISLLPDFDVTIVNPYGISNTMNVHSLADLSYLVRGAGNSFSIQGLSDGEDVLLNVYFLARSINPSEPEEIETNTTPTPVNNSTVKPNTPNNPNENRTSDIKPIPVNPPENSEEGNNSNNGTDGKDNIGAKTSNDSTVSSESNDTNGLNIAHGAAMKKTGIPVAMVLMVLLSVFGLAIRRKD